MVSVITGKGKKVKERCNDIHERRKLDMTGLCGIPH